MRDVAIVGAGPVGVFLAAALAQQGIDVVVFERRAGEHVHSRAIGIHPPSLESLESVGVAERVIAGGVRIDRGILRIDGETRAHLDFADAGGRFPFVVSLPQVETERILRARLAELAPDALRTGATVERFERRAGGVTLLVRQGEPVRGHGPAGARMAGPGVPAEGQPPAPSKRLGVERVSARLVIGADGPRSVVRAAARLPDTLHVYPYRYLMGDFADDTGEGPSALLHLHPEGIVESFPLPNGRRRWVTHLPERSDLAGEPGRPGEPGEPGEPRQPGELSEPGEPGEPDEGFAAALLTRLILDRTGAAPDAATATMTSVFGVRRRTVPRMSDGRMIVIGDAAHEVSPIGGQGMNLGWLDAAELAALIPRLLAPRPDHGILREFERRRLRSARAASRTAEFNMAMGAPCSPLTFAARRAIVAVVDSPPARRRLTRAFTMRGL
jgi:2-polyprenyl-6-methoxyphenol hydroxylase-like FAD-dependent oxidoreductase